MKSLKELYRIGPGPSSSHTMGPQKACLEMLKRCPNADHYRADRVLNSFDFLISPSRSHKA